MAYAKGNSGLTKITASFFAPMYADFNRQMERALLRRDAFLDQILEREIPHLTADLAGKRQSKAAHQYVSRQLTEMGERKTENLVGVSISLRHETADKLRKVVAEHNLVRNAFLNYVVALLRSSDALLTSLDLPKYVAQVRSTEDMPTSPLSAILEVQNDPLHYLRAACEERHECGLYDLPLSTWMHGFSCYLSDEDVPATAAFDARVAKTNRDLDLRGELDAFEANLAQKGAQS